MKVSSTMHSPILTKKVDMHSHDMWEVILYTHGKGTLTIGDVDYDFSPGMIVFQPPLIPHGEVSKAGFKNKWIRVDDFNPINGNEPFILFDDNEKSIHKLFNMIYIKSIKGENKYQQIMDFLFECIYNIVLCSKNSDYAQNPDIGKFQNLITNNFVNSKFDLQKELSEIGYSTEYFSKIFKNAIGYSPLKYLTKLRMEQSKKLIENNEIYKLSMKEIAYQCGYKNSNYFLKSFKKHYNMTPSEYEEAHSYKKQDSRGAHK